MACSPDWKYRKKVSMSGEIYPADMDSGEWPQHEGNEVLKLIRKSYTLHLAGDQHLPSVTQYGVEGILVIEL